MVNCPVPLAGLMDDRLAGIVRAFDAVALSESKRTSDAIPTSLCSWRESFEYGLSINGRIEVVERAQSQGFLRFRQASEISARVD